MKWHIQLGGLANTSGLMSDNVAVVTLRGWARGGEKKNQKTRLCCHLITGRGHEDGVISEKRFKTWGKKWQRGRREKKNIPAGQKEKGKDSEGETWGVKQKAERGKQFKQSDENNSASFPDVVFRVQTQDSVIDPQWRETLHTQTVWRSNWFNSTDFKKSNCV